jgi:LysM repeat protein
MAAVLLPETVLSKTRLCEALGSTATDHVGGVEPTQHTATALPHLRLVELEPVIPVAIGLATARTTPAPAALRLSTEVYWARRIAVVVALVLGVLAVAAVLGPLLDGVSGAVALEGASLSAELPAAYVVQPGDTVWSVARGLQPAGDLRPLVAHITSSNGGASLDVGQVLIIR